MSEKNTSKERDLEKRVKELERVLDNWMVCRCCGAVYHDSYIRQQKCPACGEGVK